MIDRTGETPTSYRIHTRDPAEVDLVVLHQTGPRLNPLALKAHALVGADGVAVQLHPWLARMRYGSGPRGNPRGVNVELEGNLPGRYHGGLGRWAQEPRDLWDAEARRAQVLAARSLLAALRAELPALRWVCAHRTLQGAEGARRRAGCPGPDLWREVGEWAVRSLGLELLPTAPGGLDLPADWRRAPTIEEEPAGRESIAPVAPSHPVSDIAAVLRLVNSRAPTTGEGVVMRGPAPHFHRVKVKSAAYVAAHRARDSACASPRALLHVVLEGQEDDVFPLLPENVRAEGERLRDRLRTWLAEVDTAATQLRARHGVDRKGYALAVQREGLWIAPMMSLWQGQATDARGWIERSKRQDGSWADSFLDALLERLS